MKRLWPLLAGIGATGGAVLHVVLVISWRPDWYRYFEAPEWVVQSVEEGDWSGPAIGLVIAALIQAAGLFAFSAARLIPRLPLLRAALVTLAAIGILRGLAIFPLVIAYPELLPRLRPFDWVAAFIWGFLGVCFACAAWRELIEKAGSKP